MTPLEQAKLTRYRLKHGYKNAEGIKIELTSNMNTLRALGVHDPAFERFLGNQMELIRHLKLEDLAVGGSKDNFWQTEVTAIWRHGKDFAEEKFWIYNDYKNDPVRDIFAREAVLKQLVKRFSSNPDYSWRELEVVLA